MSCKLPRHKSCCRESCARRLLLLVLVLFLLQLSSPVLTTEEKFLQSPQPPHPFFSPTRRLPLKAFTPTPRRGNCRDYGLTFSSDAGRTCQGNGRFLVSSLSLMWAALAPIRRRNLAYVASKLGPSLYLTGERLQAIGDCSPKQAQRQSLCRFARQLFKESEGWSERDWC